MTYLTEGAVLVGIIFASAGGQNRQIFHAVVALPHRHRITCGRLVVAYS
jgi:hypothetical protein